jgi:hypothetical protein
MAVIFLRIEDPANAASFMDLNVVAGSFHEELEWRGVERPNFEGEMLSTRRNACRLYRFTAQFLLPNLVGVFMSFIAESLDAVTGLPTAYKPMKVVNFDEFGVSQGARRGLSGIVMHIDTGEIVAVRDQGNPVKQVWTMEITMRQQL